MKNTEKSQLRQHLKFTFSHRFRVLKLKSKLKKIGARVWIDKNVEFIRYTKNIVVSSNVVIKEGAKICVCNDKSNIFIGENTTIGYHNFLFASKSISIGNNCLIAPFVYIVDSNHQIERNSLINSQQNVTDKITIEDDVWIASNSTVLKGVTIKKGAVIAANSVVNKDVGEYEIWGGSPAKKIGERK